MRPTTHTLLVRAQWFGYVYLFLGFTGAYYAQDVQNQYNIEIDHSRGGSSYSFAVKAEAKYIEAQGKFLKSAEEARKINAEAVEQEIKNSVEFVKAYFDRRVENIKRRHELEPTKYEEYQKTVARLEEMTALRIDKYFKEVLRGDVTDELNWLLRELYIVQYMSPGDTDEWDSPLQGVEQIYATDGGGGGNKLVFKINGGEMLKTPWPYTLLRSEFDSGRNEFEAARDAAIKEIQENGRASQDDGQRMWKAVEQMVETLEAAYPDAERKNTAAYLRYYSAKTFLKSLIVQVHRALATNDKSAFDGSLAFKGSTVVDLIKHMNKLGLMFDHPQSGGERVYNALFLQMRKLYLKVKTDKNNDTPPANN